MILPQPGRYTVTAGKAIVSETKNGALQLSLYCMVDDITGIVAYQYFTNRDGVLMEKTVDNLKKVFNWDGVDPFWFEDADLSGLQFDITVENSEYQGQQQTKVSWINPVGGGMESAMGQSADRKSVMARYGAKFRAISGGRPVGRSATPPANTAAPLPRPAPSGNVSNMAEVWALINNVGNANGKSPAQIETEWFDLINEFGGNRDNITPAQWGQIKMRLSCSVNASEPTDDDIPF